MTKSAAISLGSKQILIYSTVIFLTSFAAYFWYTKSDPQGEENSHCFQEKLFAVASGFGQVATSHRTVCDVMGGNSAVYVYIHKLKDSDSRSSLVFRYGDTGKIENPMIHWLSSSSVLISVSEVEEITKQMPIAADGVAVKYVVGKVDYPKER